MLAPWKNSYGQSRQHIEKQRHYFADKGLSSQCYSFSSSRVWLWELDYKESWVLQNWCFLTVVLEKTLESPLDCKEIQPVRPKGNQSWIFIGRTDAEAEAPYFGYLMQRTDSLEKTLKDRRQVKRGWQKMRWLDDIADSMDMSLSNCQELGSKTGKPVVLQSMGVTKSWTWLSDWTELMVPFISKVHKNDCKNDCKMTKKQPSNIFSHAT